MLCSADGFDLSTYDGQIAHIKAVRRRIASGRCVKGGTAPSLTAPHLALGTQNQGEGSPFVVAKEPEADTKGSPTFATLANFCAPPSAAVVFLPRPFDFASFRTEPLPGEEDPEPISFQEITRLICRELGMDRAAIWAPSRGAKHCFGRAAVWWLARRWTTLSYPLIGRLSTSRAYRASVGKDHTTVLSSVQRFEAWRAGAAHYAGLPSYAAWEASRGV